MRHFSWLALAFILFHPNTSMANVVGTDVQNFNPSTSGLDFVTVHSSETLEPGLLNVGFFWNYAVNSLPNYQDQTTQSRTDFQDTLHSSDISFGLGLNKYWDMGVAFANVHSQTVEQNGVQRGEYSDTGLTDIRANTKYRLSGDYDGGFALVLSANFNQIERNPFAGSDPGPTINAQVVYDWTIEKIALAVNAGYRFRNPGDPVASVPVQPVEDQYIASVAASYLLPSVDTKLIGEIFTSFPAESTDFNSDRESSSAELLVGVKYDRRHDLALHAGAGTEIYHGSGSPDWRIYAGLNWVIGPLFREKKTVIVSVNKNTQLEAPQTDPFEGLPKSRNEYFVAREVLFKFDSAEVQPAFKEILDRLVEYMKSDKYNSLTVEGHTDSVGPAEYNTDLSRRRAEAVRDYLVEQGLDVNKVIAVGRGEDDPIGDNGNFQGRRKNRRVEFKIDWSDDQRLDETKSLSE